MLTKMLAERKIVRGGEHFEQLLIDAGFTDVKVDKRIFDLGPWRGGSFSL
jgi:hypothetical protein